jgi:hypothetical protein
MSQMIFEKLSEEIRKLRGLRRPHRPHHANPITTEDSPHRLPKGGNRANILQGRGAKALEESVPEVAPASSQRDGAVPGAAGEGNGAVRIPTTLGP